MCQRQKRRDRSAGPSFDQVTPESVLRQISLT